MAKNIDEIRNLGKDQVDAASLVATSVAKGLQLIAGETAEFTRASVEAHSAYVEKLLGAKTLEDLVKINSEYAQANYERFVERGTRIKDLYSNLAREAFSPVEDAAKRFSDAAAATTGISKVA